MVVDLHYLLVEDCHL